MFGYRFTTAHGISMEPTLSNGDMIWLKFIDVVDIRVGDIVTLSTPEEGSVTHRVINVQALPQDGYLIETRGDANWPSEQWEINANETVPVFVARTPFAGSVVDFLSSVLGRALLITLAVATVVAMWVRRRRVKQM